MIGAMQPGSAVSERTWSAMILVLSCAVLLITIWCLSQGITIIFMHLYYVPIVLLAYHYRKKGLYLSILLSLSYFALVAAYMPDDIFTIEGAGIRSIVFIGIAALVAYLSEQLVQAQEALGRTAHIQQGIIQNANVWLMVLDSAGRILEWNTAAEEMSGFVADEVIGKNEVWKQLYPDKNYRKEITGKITEIIRQENYLENLKTVITGKDGTKKTLMWNTRILPQEEQGTQRYIAIGVDVTATVNAEYELKKAYHQLTAKEEELRDRYEDLARSRNAILESEAEYRNILRTAMDGFSIVDSTRSFLDVNDAFCTMTGYSRNELLTLSLLHIEAKEQQDEIASHMGEIIRKGADRFETKYRKKDGGIIDVEVSVVVSETHGRHFVVFHHDITEQKRAEEALQKSKEQYRNLVENINDVIFSLDEGGVITYISPAVEKITGYLPSQILGQPFTGFILKDDLPGVIQTFEAVSTGKITSFPFRIVTKSGDQRWLNSSSYPAFTNGEFSGVHGVLSDITERKRAEEALRESEEKFRDIFNNANDGIELFEIRDNLWPGRYIDVNEVGCRMLQYTKEEMLQHSPLDFDTTDYKVPPNDEVTKKILSVGHAIYETGHKRKDGKIVPVEINFHVITLRGKMTGLSIVRDISERKLVEGALRESEEKFRDIFNNANDGIEIVELLDNGMPGRFNDVNDVACRMLGYTREEMLRVSPLDIDTDYFSRPFDEIMRELHATGHATFETEHRRKDGIIVPVEVNTHKITLMGKIVFLSITRDITERKRAEAEIKRSIERFRTVMDSIDAFVYVADMQTYELLFINKYGKDIWGEIRGKVCWQTIQSDQKGPCPFCTNDRLVDEHGNPTGIYNWEFKNTVNGRWYDCRDSAIRWLDGRLVRIEIATDITGRKQIEEALRESEQKFRDLFDNSRDGIVIADIRTKKFVDSNEMFSRMLGYRPEEIKDLDLMEIHPEGVRSQAFEVFEKMVRREMNIAENLPVKRKDGTIFYADVSAYPINKSNKDYLVGVFRDITERRQAEELKNHFTEELEQQVRSRTQDLETSLDEKVVLLREVHHRVKNNLQIIISLVNLQMRKLEDPQLKQVMSETQNRVRAMALVHEKLYQSENYSRIDFADYTRFLATQLISYYGTDLRRVHLDFTMREIMVDINTAVPLGLLINELISNALKHAFPKGREGTISISGGSDGDLITLVVRDNGIGIPAELDWKNTTSLGMRLVTSLVDQIDGTITLDCNQGTAFTITVRRKPASEGA